MQHGVLLLFHVLQEGKFVHCHVPSGEHSNGNPENQTRKRKYCTVLTWAKSASPEPAAFELEAVLLLLVSLFGAILYSKNEYVFLKLFT